MQWMNEGADWLLNESYTAADLTPETLGRLGAGIAAATQRSLIGYAGQSDHAKACAMTVCGAVAAAGGETVLMPDCTPVELGAASPAAECEILLFADETRLRLYARGLLPITAAQESALTEESAHWQQRGEYGSISDGTALKMLYPARLMKHLPDTMPVQLTIGTASRRLYELLRKLPKAARGAPVLSAQLSADGRQVSLYSEKDGWFFHEKLMMMMTQNRLKHGKQAALPYWAAHIAEQMAEACGGEILRYAARSDGSDGEARALALAQGYTLDGTLLLADVLRILAEEEPDLKSWSETLPPVYTVRRLLQTERAADAAACCGTFLQTRQTPDGLRAWDARGEALLCPSHSGKTAAMLVEAASMEAAQELAGEITDALRHLRR